MKRYLVFIYDQYYPLGGFNDYLNQFETKEECVNYIVEYYKSYEYSSPGRFQIVDTDNLEKKEYYFASYKLYLD